ncbi:hypothetical protein ACFY8P_24090 [Streptomyces sp. NPDC012693]|uniref:hypothetical protein n=1 Tax=Streptomyces sp. NPDC012693 TaxID=3364844 RepID=UPI0036830410
MDTPFTVVFDRWTARLTEATAGGEKVLGGGPDLVLSRAVPGRWARTSATVTTTGGQAVVTLTGRFGTLNTTIDVSPDIVYTGAWTHADISAGYTVGDLFGTESFTDAAGAAAELAFTGTGVGPTRPWRRTWAS